MTKKSKDTKKSPENGSRRPNFAGRRVIAAATLALGGLLAVKAGQALVGPTKTFVAPVSDESWAGRKAVAQDLREQGAHVPSLNSLDVLDPSDDQQVDYVAIESHTGPLGQVFDNARAVEARPVDGSQAAAIEQANLNQRK